MAKQQGHGKQNTQTKSNKNNGNNNGGSES
ncbi:hypothetical protein FHS18_000234 [Paenibacillus phyllosphaerae]|uniref:Uncharacterized protein n=1 Tax=Paenibacillus phyllosphaerae TaxID=274593 RepID=A0A7W5FKJ8_9BACL|nr:hypothetical protein [Paenibacillus phyllosphaerae]